MRAHARSGHKFVHYNYPTANKTWVWDISTNLWHERESFDRTGNSLGSWRGSCSLETYGKTFIGDKYTGAVGYIDGNTFTEFGDNIRAELISPPIHGDGKRVFMPWFEIDAATGVGTTSGQGENPQFMLDVSDDGGQTYDGAQLWTSAGKIGQYGESRTQLRWDRLGSFYERTMRLTITDPVKRVIHAARCPQLRIGI